jgi:hypothetical protein
MGKQPDKVLVHDQLQALQVMLRAHGIPVFASAMFWILPKDGDMLPFKLNRAQLDLLPKLARNNLLLKARQMGGTTFFLLIRGLLPVLTERGINSILISQSTEFAQFHFMIPQRAIRYIGACNPFDDRENSLSLSLRENVFHTQFQNKRELYFDQLDSSFRVGSAEVEESAQGVTLHHIIASEYSRWPGQPAATLANVRGALVTGGTVDKECTANGAGGPFYTDYLKAITHPELSDAKAHFYPWWWTEDYISAELSPKQERELREDLQNDERLLVEKFHLDLKHIAWRRETKKAFPGFEFDEKYPEDWQTAFIASGNTYFDREILALRKRELIGVNPWKTFANGQAAIYKERIPGRRYIAGIDTATGRLANNDDPDYSAAVVLDLETGEEVASYRARVTPEEIAYDMADLGHYFNDALLCVERTGDGGTCILVLANECKYTAIYKHKEWWKRERKIVEFEGFPTTLKTRPVALNMLNRFVKEHPELIHDSMFLQEAMTFVRDEKGKPQADVGSHDDTVSARWVAHACRQAVLGYWEPWVPSQHQREGYIPSDRM